MPVDNQTVLGLARSFAAQVKREPIPNDDEARARWTQTKREQLQSVVRYHRVALTRTLRMTNAKGMDFESVSERFDFSNGLSATGIWFKQDASRRMNL